MSLSVNCSFSSLDSPCNHVGIRSEIIPLMACKIDIKPQLESLGASSRSRDLEIPSESDLILNQAGHFTVAPDQKAAMTICPKHRKAMTTAWAGRKVTRCSYQIVVPIGSGKKIFE